MKIGIVQYSPSWENLSESREKIKSLISSTMSGQNKIDWLVFPEMTLSGFSMDISKTSLRDIDIRFFQDVAKLQNTFITFGGVLDGFNKSITVDRDGKIISSYEKVHLFSFANEDRYYKPGGPLKQFKIDSFRITPAVCYDLRFPYLFWKAAKTTDVFVIIANWPSTRLHHWNSLLRARAIENQSYIIGVNRIGSDPAVSYSGNSVIINPSGETLLDCESAEGIFTATIDLEQVMITRSQYPFLNDRTQ